MIIARSSRTRNAQAANIVVERSSYEGIPYESRRIVKPVTELGRTPLKGPLMVGMKFWDWRLIPKM